MYDKLFTKVISINVSSTKTEYDSDKQNLEKKIKDVNKKTFILVE